MAAYLGPAARLLCRGSAARYPLSLCSSNCNNLLNSNASAPSGNLAAARRSLSSSAPVQDTVHQRIKGRRRFYKTVSVRPVEGEEQSWEILLDRHVLRTPGRRPLRFPTETLARAVAAEWDAQVAASGIEPTVMPLMTLTATAIDQISVQPAVTIENVMRYLPTDTVCFFAPEYDRIMRKRQHQHWEPLHQWMSQSVGAELGDDLPAVRRADIGLALVEPQTPRSTTPQLATAAMALYLLHTLTTAGAVVHAAVLTKGVGTHVAAVWSPTTKDGITHGPAPLSVDDAVEKWSESGTMKPFSEIGGTHNPQELQTLLEDESIRFIKDARVRGGSVLTQTKEGLLQREVRRSGVDIVLTLAYKKWGRYPDEWASCDPKFVPAFEARTMTKKGGKGGNNVNGFKGFRGYGGKGYGRKHRGNMAQPQAAPQSHQAAKRQQPASAKNQGGGGKRAKISAVQDGAGRYEAIKTLAKAAAESAKSVAVIKEAVEDDARLDGINTLARAVAQQADVDTN